MKLITNKTVLGVLASFAFFASASAQKTDAKSRELLDALSKVNGGYEALSAKNDVEIKYVYDNFEKGKDVSLERYIFDGEHSWASYEQHDINVLPGTEGVALQSFVDNTSTITLAGKAITDPKAIGGTTFLRKANYYWFAMMYKLENPGSNYKHLGTEKIGDVTYDKVSLIYDGGAENDQYVLYFNPNTHLVDQFLFSLPAWKINDPILKMTLEYEVIDGVYVATLRKGFMPNKEGGYTPIGVFTTSNVKFNNGFKKEDLLLK